MKKSSSRKWFRVRVVILLSLALTALAVAITDYLVISASKGKVYADVQLIPKHKVGLLLGTSKYLKDGRINLYYRYRIEAAAALYHADRIKFILISGDNGRKDYNEPEMMRDDLIAAGVPAEKIVLDYAGFRTLDSIVRCREVFGETEIAVISQLFHNQRAIFIGSRKGMNITGFNARGVDVHYGFKTQLREKFARVKMVLDLTFQKQPRYLGERIEIK